MKEIVCYLTSLNLNDYRSHLGRYLPRKFIQPQILKDYMRHVFLEARKVESSVYIDPLSWLEQETENFCTADVNDGCKFEQKSNT